MEKIIGPSQDRVTMRIPVRIAYTVLETFLRKKIVGENIKVKNKDGEETNYAEILDIAIAKSKQEDYDISLYLKFKTLTSLFRNKEGSAVLHAAIYFDEGQQQMGVQDFNLVGTSNSWFMDKSLQAVANTFMHERLKKKMKFDFGDLVENQVMKVNGKLNASYEASEGIFLSGRVNTFKVKEVLAGESHLLISVALEGNTVVDIQKIDF